MVDNRAISYVDTLDPAACNLNVTGNWMEESRDPERKSFLPLFFFLPPLNIFSFRSRAIFRVTKRVEN